MKKRGPPTLETLKLAKSVKTANELKRLFDERNEDVNGLIDNYTFTSYVLIYYSTFKYLIELLLEYGIDLETRNGLDGMTAIHVACYFNRTNAVKMLLDYGSNVFAKGKSGMTALDYALGGSPTDIFNILLDFGAPLPKKPELNTPLILRSNYEFILYYNSTVQRRISSCRQALLALLRICNNSPSHTKGPFGALRGVMLQMASQSWAMRGGEGCGARAHEWSPHFF